MQFAAIQPQKHFACRNRSAFLDHDLGHHAAIKVLDHLSALSDLNLARGDDRPGQRRHHRPSAKAADQQQQGSKTPEQRFARRPVLVLFGHGVPAGIGVFTMSV